jgi:DNA-binding NarL/FixJ family response regulator
MAVELVGRDTELRRAELLAESLGVGSAAVLIGGGAGIGKTAVWRAAADAAAAAGVRVLVTRGSEVEMPIPLGHLADLLADVLPVVAPELPEPQRGALEVAVGVAGPAAFQPDWLALARATLATLSLLARDRPVLLAVDDAQWLDPASQRVLAYAFRRAGAGIGLLATVRDETATLDPLALGDTVDVARFTRIQLGPLSAGALQRVLRTRLGVYLPRPTLARIHEASGGNPMFALEFARLMRGAPGRPGPLAVPRTLNEVVAERVSRLPAEIGPLLEVISAVERPTFDVATAVLGDPEAVESLLAKAVAADALASGDEGSIGFTHPLLAAAVYHRIPPARRRALHARLARVVGPVEERGRHAALACEVPDAATAALVAEAASAAASRGALQAAAELAAEAARLEPDPRVRCERLIEAAAHLVDTGEFAAAREVLEPLLADGLSREARGRALLVRAEAEIANRELLVRYLNEGLVASDDEHVRWQALVRIAQHGHWITGDAVGATATAQRALEVAEGLGDPDLIAESRSSLAFYAAAAGERTQEEDEEAEPMLSLHAPWWNIGPGLSLATRLMWAGRLEEARRVAVRVHARLVAAGREARAGFVLVTLAEIDWRAGRWDDAEAAEAEATDILGDLVVTAVPRLILLAARGEEEQARRLGADMLEWCAGLHDRYSPLRVWWSLGQLELSRGNPTAAGPLLETALEHLEAGGLRNPGYVPVLPDVIECRVAGGRLAEADALAARLEADAALVATAWAAASALRGRALVLLAHGDGAAAADGAQSCAAAFGALGAPFEEARALLLVGDARRRLGERRLAAAAIGRAGEIFSSLGARLWRERAERELRRASPRSTGDRDALTPAEERVATLVAAGRTNKETAAELFTTVATVEAHLTRIYRKLGVRSRTDLMRRVADGTVVVGAAKE